MPTQEQNNTASNAAGKVAKILFLSLFALALVVVSVSFAVHHMRLGFEKEFDRILISRVQTDASNAALAVNGDDIVNDPAQAAVKYSAVLQYMLMDANDDDYTNQAFCLYNYSNGALSVLAAKESDILVASTIPVSEWLSSEIKPYEIKDKYVYHYMVPITDSEGKVCALLELSAKSDQIGQMGNGLEKVILKTVILAVFVALFIFSLQYLVPPIITLVSKKQSEAGL